MDASKMVALRSELEERRDRLQEGQARRMREVEQSADHATPDALDLAAESADFDVAVHTAFRGCEELETIRVVIDKLDSGTYGRCDDCRKPIAEKRLEALPLAVLCIDCQREFERHGGYARSAFEDSSYAFDDE